MADQQPRDSEGRTRARGAAYGAGAELCACREHASALNPPHAPRRPPHAPPHPPHAPTHAPPHAAPDARTVTLDVSLIARRSADRAGTRHWRRGADASGAVANLVETEQLVAFDGGAVLASYVEVRTLLEPVA